MRLQHDGNKELSIGRIRDFVIWWNSTYPIDYWWRNKYQIPFGSEAHRSQGILDMRIEYEEERLVAERALKSEEKSKYSPGRGDWLSRQEDTVELTTAQASDVFEELDIAKLQQMDLDREASGDKDSSINIKKR